MKPKGFSVMFLGFDLALKITFMKPCFFDVRKNISSFLCLLKNNLSTLVSNNFELMLNCVTSDNINSPDIQNACFTYAC